MSNYLSIDNIQTSGHLPYIFGDLANGTFPGTIITDRICDIDFSSMEIQYDISLNEVHYTVNPVEYLVDGNRYYVLGNARFAFSSDIASDTGEQFAIVVDADAYDNQASTISRKLYIGLLETDDSAMPIDAIELELRGEEEGEEGEESEVTVEVTRRSSPNTYIFEVGGATSLNTTISKSYGSEMIVHINPVQTGSGTPSPSNVRPIEGWTAAILTGTNINEQSSYAVDWADSVGTVYGGTLNVNTGLMIITHACIDSYDGESLPGEWISSMDSYSSGSTPTTGSQVVYELDSPIRQYIYISDENLYLELQNPTSNTGTVDVINYSDEIYTIGTSDAENPLTRRRALKITGTTGAIIIGNGTLLSLSDYPSYTPIDTGEDFAVLIPDVYATANDDGEIPATVAISDRLSSSMTSAFAMQVLSYGLDRFRTFGVDDYIGSESGETGSLYRMLNEYGQAGPIPDIDDSKYDEALHGQNIVANTILAQQIDVRDLMAQDLSVTGKIHSSNKTSATDNNEGFFLGYEPVNGVNRATFGVGASDNAHITYTGTSLDIKTNWLKFDEEDGVQIGQSGQSRSVIGPHSIYMADKDDNVYFLAEDRRRNGIYVFSEEDGNADIVYPDSSTTIYANYDIDTNYPVTVKHNGVEVAYTSIGHYRINDDRMVGIIYGTGFDFESTYSLSYTTRDPVHSMRFGARSKATAPNAICFAQDGEASYANAFAIGDSTKASGSASFASGKGSISRGRNSFSAGEYSYAIGDNSLSLGYYCQADGVNAVAFNEQTRAKADNSCAMGCKTKATGLYSYASGLSSVASNTCSSAIGEGTYATRMSQTTIGRYNSVTIDASWDEPVYDAGDYAFIIGNGTGKNNRSNALTVDWNGNIKIYNPNLTVGTTPSANNNNMALYLGDKNGNRMGCVAYNYSTNGDIGIILQGYRNVNSTNYYNTLNLSVDTSGGYKVTVSAPAAWRTALGLNNILDLFRVVSVHKTNVSISANSTASAAIPFTVPSGFTAVCIVNTRCDATDTTSGAHFADCFVYNSWISGTTANLSIRNVGSSAAKVTAWAYILFDRNTL